MDCVDVFFREEHDQLVLVASKYVKSNAEDLVQDCVVQIYTNKERYIKICQRGELFFYLIRIFRLAGFSKTSQYFYKYRRHEEQHRPIHEIELASEEPSENWMEREIQLDLWTSRMMLNIEEVLMDLSWFESELFKIYYLHNHTITSLSNDTGISRTTINRSVRKTKAYLQKTYAQKDIDWTGRHDREDNPSNGNQSNCRSSYGRLRMRREEEKTKPNVLLRDENDV